MVDHDRRSSSDSRQILILLVKMVEAAGIEPGTERRNPSKSKKFDL
jgi:hypothetical protein